MCVIPFATSFLSIVGESLILTDFSPGMYTFTLVENGKIASEKIIIE